MPVPAPTANLALSLVSGMIRMIGKVDRIMAEKTAVMSDLALVSRGLVLMPPAVEMKQKLSRYANDTSQLLPDPIAATRPQLLEVIDHGTAEQMLEMMQLLIPEQVKFDFDNPDDFRTRLAERGAAFDLDDSEVQQVLYFLEPGKDERRKNGAWQLAMVVTEVLLDVAIANQELILKNAGQKALLAAVLQRFADADLSEVSTGRMFLKILLRQTLNGAIDHASELEPDNPWVDGLLDAIADTRDDLGDDFLVGLVQGKGYTVFVANLVEEGAERLQNVGAAESHEFKQIAADVMKRAAEEMSGKPQLRGFFNDHWTDLLQAGFLSLGKHGPAILEDESPIVRETLLSAVKVLGEADTNDMDRGLIVEAVEAAIATVAIKPELLGSQDLHSLVENILLSTAGIVRDKGIGAVMSPEAMDHLLRDSLGFLSENPELLVKEPGLNQRVVGGIVRQLAAPGARSIESIAIGTVEYTLLAIAEDPQLVDTKYPEIVAGLAGEMGKAVADGCLTRHEAEVVLKRLASDLSRHPEIITDDDDSLAGRVLSETLATLAGQPALFDQKVLAPLLATVLNVIAGDKKLVKDNPDLVKGAAGAVLEQLSAALAAHQPISVQWLAQSAVMSVLSGIAERPNLLTNNQHYAKAAGNLAGALAMAYRDGAITRQEAEGLLEVCAQILLENTRVLAEQDNELLGELLKRVIQAVVSHGIRGVALQDLVSGIVQTVATYAHNIRKPGEPLDDLVERVQAVLDAALKEAHAQLGIILAEQDVGTVIICFLRYWATDRVPTLEAAEIRVVLTTIINTEFGRE